MKRHAIAMWYGSGKEGAGDITTQSLMLHQAQYSYNSRFSDNDGTSPGELLAAAHAGCYTMKLSFTLTAAGFIPERLQTMSHINYENGSITESHLEVIAEVPGIDAKTFKTCINEALHNCPVTKVLRVKISIEHSLVKYPTSRMVWQCDDDLIIKIFY